MDKNNEEKGWVGGGGRGYEATLYFGSSSFRRVGSSLGQTSICEMAIVSPNQSAKML